MRYENNLSSSVINKELDKCFSRIKKMNTDTIFIVKLFGVDFDISSFLLTGMAYASSDTHRYACAHIAKNLDVGLSSYIELQELRKKYGEKFDEFDLLLPSYTDSGWRDSCAYLYTLDRRSIVLLLFRSCAELIQALLVDLESPEIKFSIDSIANSQGFSYYLMLYWFFHLFPNMTMYFGRDFKNLNLQGKLEKLCPEGCSLRRYITGELNLKEAVSRYSSERENGVSEAQLEMLSLMTDGAIKLEEVTDYHKVCANDGLSLLLCNREYKLNLQISYCLLNGGILEKNQSEKKELENRVVSLEQENEHIKSRLSSLTEKLKPLESTLADKDKELSQLRILVSKHKSNDELERKVAELEARLKEKDIEIDMLFEERFDLKQQVSSQKKQIKQLTSSSSIEHDSEEVGLMEISEELSVEDKVSSFKDLSILIVGGDDLTYLESSLAVLGVENVKRFTRNTRDIGNCDIIVILTIRVSHSDVYRVEKLAKSRKAKIVYINNVNTTKLVEQIYEELQNN